MCLGHELMLDGVNILQCEKYSIKENGCTISTSGSCMKDKCQTFMLLKELQTKDQEIKRLDRTLSQVFDDNNFLYKRNSELELTIKEIYVVLSDFAYSSNEPQFQDIRELVLKIVKIIESVM